MFSAPRMLVWTASNGLYSEAGTCFSAAAWTTTSTPRSRPFRRSTVADVAEQEAQPAVAVEAALHLRLLELVAAVDADRRRLVLGQERATKTLPKEPVPPVSSTTFSLIRARSWAQWVTSNLASSSSLRPLFFFFFFFFFFTQRSSHREERTRFLLAQPPFVARYCGGPHAVPRSHQSTDPTALRGRQLCLPAAAQSAPTSTDPARP